MVNPTTRLELGCSMKTKERYEEDTRHVFAINYAQEYKAKQ